MTHLRIVRGVYYVRVVVPKDRWGDVGRVMSAKSGQRRELQKTLKTDDRTEAIRRLPEALQALLAIVNKRLVRAGLAPVATRRSWEQALAGQDVQRLEQRDHLLNTRPLLSATTVADATNAAA
jgi:hypothetical protein